MDSALPLILAASALGDVAEKAGTGAVALLAAGALLARGDRSRALAVLGALAVAPVVLVAHIWDSPQVAPLRQRPALVA